MATKKSTKAKTADQKVQDSFQNFGASMGWGANPLFSGGNYGFNPISRNRTLLEWMYRGSWVVGVVVDVVADDMTREGVEFLGTSKPDDIEKLQTALQRLQMWHAFNLGVKWGRLYGGAIAVALVDGQDVAKPFDAERVGKGQFKGFAVLDRWMVEPSLNVLVKEYGPGMGLPEFYKVTNDPASVLIGKKIHHSRCIRFEGIDLPWWQKQAENMWGISVVERLFDRLIAFDSATTGVAQLVYKAYLRTYKVEGLREIIADGGPQLAGLMQQLKMIRDFQSNEGLTVIDKMDEMDFDSYAFSGLDNVLAQMGQQLSGATQVPLTRLFGQSPGGMNSTGESDLQNYDDGIKQKQELRFRPGLSRFLPAIAKSEGVALPDGWNFVFQPLRQLKDEDRADMASKTTDAVLKAYDSNVIRKATALKELRQTSAATGIFTNVSDEEIKEAEDEPPMPSKAELAMASMSGDDDEEEAGAGKKRRKVGDSVTIMPGFDVVIETTKGMTRSGGTLRADYGYLRGIPGADGDDLDCFVGPNPKSGTIWILETLAPDTGAFDEHKVMMGYDTRLQALGDFAGSYHDGALGRLGTVTKMSTDQFRDWIKKQRLRVVG